MEQHTLGAEFYAVTVGICKTNRILYDPINKTIKIPAKLDSDGRECIFPPGLKNGLYPGVRRGGMWVIRPKDAKKRHLSKLKPATPERKRRRQMVQASKRRNRK